MNVDGEVVAVSVLKASNLDGVSFGIPIDTVVECVHPPSPPPSPPPPIPPLLCSALTANAAAMHQRGQRARAEQLRPGCARRRMVRQMRKFGKVLRPVLGVRMISLDAETAAVIRSRNPSVLPPDLTRGVIITHVRAALPPLCGASPRAFARCNAVTRAVRHDCR